MKGFSPACERNKEPILSVLLELLPDPTFVLEVGSGTGQHAAYFARALPHVIWQPTDVAHQHASIQAYRDEAGVANFLAPLVLDLSVDAWPVCRAGALVCINTVHIVSWSAVQSLFRGAAAVLSPDGFLYLYGPFRYAHRALEPSNEQFDYALKRRDPNSGVRDFAAVDALAVENGLQLDNDVPMPANNRSIWWRKQENKNK